MPWLIQHKCNILDRENTAYSALAGKRTETGEEITRVLCPECREEFVILGWDFFKEAHQASELNLPPGFVVARTRRA